MSGVIMRLRIPLLTVVAALLAFAAWRDAAAEYWLGMGKEAAPWPLEDDSRFAVATGDAALRAGEGRSPAFWQAMSATARAALHEDALGAPAMRQLGVAADALGQPGLIAYLALAERVSRRDALTQIAFLRLAVKAGDYPRTFRHLDTILTTEPSAGEQFFAPMAVLLADPQVREVLAPYAGRRWFGNFAIVAVKESENPADLAALLMNTRAPLPETPIALLPRLLGRLAEAGEYAAARQLAVRRGKASPAALDDFGMTRATTDPRFAPLTWNLADTNAVQTALVSDDAIEAQLRPGVAATVAERVTALASGAYAIEQKAARIGDSDGDLIVAWELRCRKGDKQELAWRQRLPMQGAGGRYRSQVQVPANCPVQLWRLTALADETQSDAAFTIAAVRIAPA